MSDDPATASSAQSSLSTIDTTVPHSARIWNYWLGGKDNYAVDRDAGDRYRQTFPGIVDMARTGRGFLTRVVRHLAGEAGIRQFLDIGTGLPTADNTHEIAQRVAPESRVVYVDNDPLVLAHARALLTSTAEGSTDYLHADVRDTRAVLDKAAQTLDFGRPVAVMLLGVLGLVPDDDIAGDVVRRLVAAVPSGSYLVIGDATDTDPSLVEAQDYYNERDASPYRLRSPGHIAGFFDGLEFVSPGLVSYPQWRPDAAANCEPSDVGALGGVARIP
ncbi:SAM-dependent methyltransferase [Saccharopolyspora erythraea]|uniref:SAM-dependent methyltransferase n=1 Tax=Saccharopolyspora erythraea TaxID=1836 RepID=UPI001BAE2847|nr:SAM-dependent methyltransferase [Saccharopolyspora erythraea]QUH04873.1 SAM-dependent methyltransferase [Saccharopolyspora erythraea]